MMFQPLTEPMPRPLPNTVDQVVTLLYEDISFRDKVVIAGLAESELEPLLYKVMAKTIREEFGIFSGNSELLNSCCRYIVREYPKHQDPVMIIIKELWKKAEKTHRLHLVDGTRHQTAKLAVMENRKDQVFTAPPLKPTQHRHRIRMREV